MNHLLPVLRLPWQAKPARQPRWTQPAHPHQLLRHIRRCWGCGRFGVSFCPVECRPYTGKNLIPAWTPVVVVADSAAEEAADARAAAVLDGEVA